MEQWYLGTMGFSYKDWKDVFYPAGTRASDYLAYYSRIFNAVEMDTTLYGVPRASTVEGWAAVTPDEFKFCAKTPRLITHEYGLTKAAGPMQEFIGAMRLLGSKLGAILIQLPPSFDISNHLTLAAFLEELETFTSGVRVAIEFRHASWFTSPTAELLRRHGVAWAATEFPRLPRQVNQTASFLYVRWIGRHGSYDHHDHERVDKTTELRAWLAEIQAHADPASPVFGFFNNDYAGFAAGTCNRFKEIAGLPVAPFRPPEQGRLF
jgi:uncharacterized protein YecE (DUF72 family)